MILDTYSDGKVWCISTLYLWAARGGCYVQFHCVLIGFGLADSQQWLDEHSKFDGSPNRRLRHHFICLYTFLLTSTTLYNAMYNIYIYWS